LVPGGILTKEDLRRYRLSFAEAVPIQLNGSLTAFTTPAPSSGPILAFILNILFGLFFLLFCFINQS
jgi:gamma-glutamyltranspeptidase / glutathione hydrolase / leukotriene-C4 hydrolase